MPQTDLQLITEQEAFASRSPKTTKAKIAPHKNGHSKVTVRSRGRGLSKHQKRRLLCEFGYVYGIGCGRELLKVGMAIDVEARMKSLSGGNPFTIRLRYCLSVPPLQMDEVERWLHKRLRPQRLHKEWFSGKDYTFDRAFAEAMANFPDAMSEDEMIGMQEPDWFGGNRRQVKLRQREPFLSEERALVEMATLEMVER